MWVVIGLATGGCLIGIILVLLVWIIFGRRSEYLFERDPPPGIPISKEIKEVAADGQPVEGVLLTIIDKSAETNAEKVVLHIGFGKKTHSGESSRRFLGAEPDSGAGSSQRMRVVSEMENFSGGEKPEAAQNCPLEQSQGSEIQASECSGSLETNPSSIREFPHIGWGQWFPLEDLKAATGGFSEKNVVGEGGYGIVYRGQLSDGSLIAVKNLLNNRKQAEQEFKVEVEAVGRIRHKNLVRLLGCCIESNYRILVYEYVNNGNLDQWLHGKLARSDPLTWESRVKIALGAAKALAYLHEALDPKVVHRDIKASNILLDHHWNAKISDFGLAKLLGDGESHVTTRVMGTFGYVAPEYANTGLLNEKSDVYSFGVLLMEIVTGRDPVDYCRPIGQVNLVDWLKYMVVSQHAEDLVDPQLPAKPSESELKRMLLVALRCVDMNSLNRPAMGHVVHMLEAEQSSFMEAGGTMARIMNASAGSLNKDLLQFLAMETSHANRTNLDPSDEEQKQSDT